MSLFALNDELTQEQKKKKEYLKEVDCIVPWEEWISLIQPCYKKENRAEWRYAELVLESADPE